MDTFTSPLSKAISLHELVRAADRGSGMPLPSGDEARRLREAADVSPTAFAAAVGISEQTLSRYERGVSQRFLSHGIELRVARILRHLRDQLTEAEAK